MPMICVRDIEMNYELHGDRGPVVLLVHGLGSSMRDWELQIADLAQRYRVLAVDLRGHGKTSRKGAITMVDFAADLEALLAMLEIRSAHVIGISMGAGVAFQLAVRCPDQVDSLVIINSGPEGPCSANPAHMQEVSWRTSAVREHGMRGVGRLLADRLLPAAEHEALRATFVERWADNDPEMYLASLAALVDWSVRDQLRTLTCPCVVISGDRDYTPISFKQAYLAELPGAELVVIASSGHMTTHDQPKALNETILRYMDRWTRPAASAAS